MSENLLTPENITTFTILVSIILYQMTEKKEFKTEIKELNAKVSKLQDERLEESKSIVELTIELIQKINRFDGYRS